MKIIGTSGVSILLAGQVMLRHNPVICIQEPELINNHSAVLRFKSDTIFKFLNIPCQKVIIDKIIKYKGELFTESNLKFQNMYSYKVTGNILDRSIRNLESEIRYIAPDNFFDLLTIGLNIKPGCDLMAEAFDGDYSEPKLSYIKMPNMMDKLGVEKPEFSFNPVHTINCKILSPEINVYQTVYYPGEEDYYRASITKDNLIIEFIREPNLATIGDLIHNILEEDFGLPMCELAQPKYNHLPVGKMNPINERVRKQFIFDLTSKYNIYSFGRNGIWKSIRLDSLFDDLHQIDKMIRSGNYERNKLK